MSIARRSFRKLFVQILLALLLLLVAYEIITLHFRKVDNASTLREKGINQSVKSVLLRGYRGKIIDRNNKILALTVPLSNIIIDPTLLSRQLYAKVAENLDIDMQSLVRAVKNSPSRKYLKIKQNLVLFDPILENIKKFRNQKHPIQNKNGQISLKFIGGAILLEPTSKRYYPEADATAPLLGLINKQKKGVTGLERVYNQFLMGKNGVKLMAFSSDKQPYADVKIITKAKQGKTLKLTIDAHIQFFAYSALKNAVDKHKAAYGGAVVLAANGEVLAIANYPSTDPNNRKEYHTEHYRNHALSDKINLGSTVKPFVALLALDKGRIEAEEIFDVSKAIGRYKPDGKYEYLSTEQILKKSHNLGILNIGARLSKEELWQMFSDLGFGKTLGMMPKVEHSGILKPYMLWHDLDKQTITFGYGPMEATLAQLAHAYLIFANGGTILPLKLVQKAYIPHQAKKIFSKEATEKIVKMLDATVSKKGSGYAAQIKNYNVAGKTGTTRLLKKDGTGYDENRHGTFFVGFVPAYHPKYIMAIYVSEPKGKYVEGSNVAAPVFKEAMNNILKFKFTH